MTWPDAHSVRSPTDRANHDSVVVHVHCSLEYLRCDLRPVDHEYESSHGEERLPGPQSKALATSSPARPTHMGFRLTEFPPVVPKTEASAGLNGSSVVPWRRNWAADAAASAPDAVAIAIAEVTREAGGRCAPLVSADWVRAAAIATRRNGRSGTSSRRARPMDLLWQHPYAGDRVPGGADRLPHDRRLQPISPPGGVTGMRGSRTVEELIEDIAELRAELERYRKRRHMALEQLDWCIEILHERASQRGMPGLWPRTAPPSGEA
jgi:hypothetical protein